MKRGDSDTWYAFACLNRFNWKPHEFIELPPREKAAVIAFIDELVKEEKKATARSKG